MIRSNKYAAVRYEKKFQTTKRLPPLLNAFVGGSAATDFWGIFGDNFYDRQGDVTKGVYDQIDIATKSKIMLTVPGNHDYWVLGAPAVGAAADQVVATTCHVCACMHTNAWSNQACKA